MKSAPRFLPIAILVGAVTIVVSAQTSKAPRTSWGAPDLQGIWNTNTFLPLERAANQPVDLAPVLVLEDPRVAGDAVVEPRRRPGVLAVEDGRDADRVGVLDADEQADVGQGAVVTDEVVELDDPGRPGGRDSRRGHERRREQEGCGDSCQSPPHGFDPTLLIRESNA